ncbi:MAG: hypothetical protein IH594_15590, partial [Bacteroidales bacterium]|nr:hypothetical protein [Bacteroidales bacterium]
MKAGKPISQHPENPHYFEFKGKPTIIITSGEHYGAVLNLDFDYVSYLNTLEKEGLNGTRLCSGANPEYQGWYNIRENTWAPEPGRYACPWERSDIPGYFNGGNKFDLTKFDISYFRRLKDFMTEAAKRDIIVELFFFTAIYNDSLWEYNPMKGSNNINGIGNVSREMAYNPYDSLLIGVQKALVKEIVTELNEFDNLIYEVANEPYWNRFISEAWQDTIIKTILETEAALPKKHLISQNVNNYYTKVTDPNPGTGVFNFHYANQSNAYLHNLDLLSILGCNETGFSQADSQYRREAYVCMLSGGAYFNHLDYSFTVKDPTGLNVPQGNPGGGGPLIRKQLKILKDFMESFDFLSMKPDHSIITEILPQGTQGYVLCEEGKQYAVFIRGGNKSILKLSVPPGAYDFFWLDTRTGAIIKSGSIISKNENVVLTSPDYSEDIALKIFKPKLLSGLPDFNIHGLSI